MPPTGLRFGTLVVAVLGLVLAAPGTATAQIPPDAEWSTRTTAHFRVTYPERLPELGRRAASRAEAAYRVLEDAFVEPPDGRIDVVVTDHSDLSNGFAGLFPTNRVVVVAPPPTDGLSLAYFDDWLDLVLVHELVHIFHMDEAELPGSLFRAIFGRVPVPWPTFPGLATPGWTREGLATWYESALTGAGRTGGTYFEMVLRTAALEGAFEELDEASGTSPVWPDGDRPYAYGSAFFDYLLERHGREKTDAFVRAVAGQWIPYRLNAAAEESFGVGFGEAWGRWREDVARRAESLVDSLARRAPLTRSEELVGHGRWALRPTPAPDGESVAYIRSDGTTDVQIHVVDPDGAGGRKWTRTNGLSDFAWTPDGDIVLAQLEYADRYRLRSDLYRAGPDGRVRRLTRGARLDQPHVAPGGEVAVAVQEGEGTNRLVEVDLADGSVRPLGSFREGVHWAYPRISPDGDRIAVSRWRSGGWFDVVILDREGRLLHEVTRDRAVDLAPAWSPDGRWLVWGSDRTGVWNVLAVGADPDAEAPGPVRQLTNMGTGAAYPAVGADGRWLYYSGYHADGWRIERIPFRPDRAFEAFALDPRFHAVPEEERSGVAEGGSLRGVGRVEPAVDPGGAAPYSPMPTILPRYWLPDVIAAEEAVAGEGDARVGPIDVLGPALGVQTSGRDVLGRHTYGMRALVSPGSGRFEGAVGYAYGGLGNPILELGLSQFYDAAPRGVTVGTEEGGEEVLFQVDREREVSVATGFVRRRYRDVVSLRLGAGYIREHVSFLTPALDESERFRAPVPDRDLLEARITLAGDRIRSHPFSISPEDGVRGFVRLRARSEVGLADSLANVAGFDRTFQDAVAGVRLYKALGGPGFASHVLAARVRGGAARGPGADAGHYEVGGAAGRPEPLTGLGLFGGSSLLFPVRGFAEGVRFGRYAWSATAEYRFPLLIAHEGLSLLPIHLDRISGSLFFEAGNAWGPLLGTESVRFQNPRRSALASGGAEISTLVLPFWTGTLTVRTGVAVPVAGGGDGGASVYLRLGGSF